MGYNLFSIDPQYITQTGHWELENSEAGCAEILALNLRMRIEAHLVEVTVLNMHS